MNKYIKTKYVNIKLNEHLLIMNAIMQLGLEYNKKYCK